MPVPVREMPFEKKKRTMLIEGVQVDIFAYEPVVWVSVTPPDVTVLPPEAIEFPALVDTGNTVAFNIREDHLIAWTGLRAVALPQYPGPPGRVTDASGTSARLPRREARVWLHPYPEGTALAPRDLQVVGGILVYECPQAGQSPGVAPQLIGPHLPLLGARAFFPTNLQVIVDYQRLLVTLRDEE